MTKKSPPPVDFNLNQHIENLPRAVSSGKRKDNFFFQHGGSFSERLKAHSRNLFFRK